MEHSLKEKLKLKFQEQKPLGKATKAGATVAMGVT